MGLNQSQYRPPHSNHFHHTYFGTTWRQPHYGAPHHGYHHHHHIRPAFGIGAPPPRLRRRS